MREENFTINSEPKWNAFILWAQEFYKEHKYVTFRAPRVGPDRSLDQNALFHVWCTEMAAHYLGKDKKLVTKGELAGMKRHVKRDCYNDNGWEFLITVITNPKTGESKKDYASSRDWGRGEMYQVLTWVQMKVSFDGLILESKGEFQKLQREEVA